MSQIIQADLVVLDENLGTTSHDVIRQLATRVVAAGRATDVDGLYGDALAREGQAATGLPGGIGIPHCRSESVSEPTLAFARLKPGVDFGAPDGPADIVFLIAAPAGGDADHLTLLTALARSLVKPEFTAALRAADSPDELVSLVQAAVAPAEQPTTPAADAPADTAAAAADEAPAAERHLVAVTACPTGIAHTYMAADSLVAAGERAGVKVHVETQGSGASTPLPADVIASAEAVIFATDVGVKDRGRFAGKPVVASGVKRAINEPDAMVADALEAASDPDAPKVEGAASAESRKDMRSGNVSWAVRLRQILLTGVSYMIPFVAAGGLLIALGFLLGGYRINASAADIVAKNSLADLPAGGLDQYLGAVLFSLGALAFGFLVPALAGYIAFAIADRPGIAPGFTVGVVATTVGAGFIGGIVGGLLAGFAALWISRLKVPAWGRGLMPVVVIPLGASLFAGGLMFLVLGRPLAAITSGLESWLNGLSGSSAIVLGIVLGLMMAFDMGGPVNKAAYAFATAGLSVDNPASLKVMAAVMAAGMVPPLALALATAVRPKLFSPAERENGKAAWLLGASFISEGAIPFAAADPLRVIPSIMIGSAATGALVMAGGVTLSAPHGGIFVFFAIGHVAVFVLALVAGAAVGAVAVSIAKQLGRKSSTTTTPAAVAA
ncbi:PTS fructose transporter subunit IIABC [Kribbella shirazensis]|uniref:PTS system fructose-specific IIC component n=1 Tax=Kribbella shirazensis TaxID=1105143 RepID=A0A7X5VHV0_9ACTN|nr:fructose-specific PTS transporter subunit EIIC [Kribbella shirazensis]NIK61495.1 PTS system fructose-specific IIC component [Kribbella shirazensis]